MVVDTPPLRLIASCMPRALAAAAFRGYRSWADSGRIFGRDRRSGRCLWLAVSHQVEVFPGKLLRGSNQPCLDDQFHQLPRRDSFQANQDHRVVVEMWYGEIDERVVSE